MGWIKVVVQATAGQLDEVESNLWEAGATSVTVTDRLDNPIFEPGPGETPLWQEINVEGLFEEMADISQVQSAVQSAGFDILSTETIHDRHWEREWLQDFAPMRFGTQLWIIPSGFAVPAEAEGGTLIKLDPGLAFGTGTHATHATLLEWLDGAALSGKTVLDFGCGSGILAIAAARLGASRVVAIDSDAQAITAAEENAQRNGVTIEAYQGTEPFGDSYDVVLANILAGPLVDLAPGLTNGLVAGGDIVLSGILANQLGWIEESYQQRVNIIGHRELDDWVCVHGRR